ncbi:MAG TPA: hypothetical protein DG754_01610 [Bacteroidales bacterium]|nr:hypothetical protein [Bacteroidales bacterium]
MQNPSEPDATFRRKGKKESIGYALNLVEIRDEKKNLGLILHHEQQQNSISDVEFGSNTLDAAIASKIDSIASDGAYFSSSNVEVIAQSKLSITTRTRLFLLDFPKTNALDVQRQLSAP